MAKTTAALLERALQIVDEVGGGQTASAEDQQFALDALLSVVAELDKRDVGYVGVNTSDLQVEGIPDYLFNSLAALLAADLQTTFAGGIVDETTREGIINRIRRLTAIGPSYAVLKSEYF